MNKQGKLVVMDHPLIKHKITLLRDENTGTKEFRELVHEIATLMAYEATRDLPMKDVQVKTPIQLCTSPIISGRMLAVVPILRAGLGMVEAFINLIPGAKVGHIGLYRDPVTHLPVEYYCKLPADIEERDIFVVDPMLATGKSAAAAINFIKERGGKNIKLLSIISAPEGIAVMQEEHPDVDVYVGVVDEKLNENKYIVPGLGDAGDRLFGTK
ncbi:MAG: uracil phosphoribosyltransferase [Clostridiales bacterium]|nr:uracil phosphoribosyltransferase [Clostridiales bacterium]